MAVFSINYVPKQLIIITHWQTVRFVALSPERHENQCGGSVRNSTVLVLVYRYWFCKLQYLGVIIRLKVASIRAHNLPLTQLLKTEL